jgi:hypothetical protein
MLPGMMAGMIDPRQRQTCKACGRPNKFDFHVPDKVWAAVVPPELVSARDFFSSWIGSMISFSTTWLTMNTTMLLIIVSAPVIIA